MRDRRGKRVEPELKEYILSLGADLAGFADIAAIPAESRSNLPYGISLGIALDANVVREIPNGTVIPQYSALCAGITGKLSEISGLVCDYIKKTGYAAIPQNDEVNPNRLASGRS